eukprot:15839-Chlamydomonas_euryale.AAC.1
MDGWRACRWTSGQVHGCMHGWAGGQVDRWAGPWVHAWVGGWLDRAIGGWTEGSVVGHKDGWSDGGMGGCERRSKRMWAGSQHAEDLPAQPACAAGSGRTAHPALRSPGARSTRPPWSAAAPEQGWGGVGQPVSYTHLTLPTILLV